MEMEAFMRNCKNRGAPLARGFAVFCAALIAAGGGASAAPTETVLHSFTGSDGSFPHGELVIDSNGNLYGMASSGGASNRGVVFKLSPDGAETVLHSFCSLPGCADGASLSGGLIAGSDGNLYGTTDFGGAENKGVVFKLAPDGTHTVLHSFCSLPSCSDGAYPNGSLLAGADGNFYGVTRQGGLWNCEFGCGLVFKLAPDGSETVLHYFCSLPNCSDGVAPNGGLIADASGNLYGTTREGGDSNLYGLVFKHYGVAFKLAPDGTYTVLHTFCSWPSCADGAYPVAGLTADSAGNLYGMTSAGWGADIYNLGRRSHGVVFKLAPDGSETVLHNFCNLLNCSDGDVPQGRLIVDQYGNLYGTTQEGGASRYYGVAFKLSPLGFETVLHSFTRSYIAPIDGGNPSGGLTADGSGNLYGSTALGGTGDDGVIFELTGTGYGAQGLFGTQLR